jgi:hypothetical protein
MVTLRPGPAQEVKNDWDRETQAIIRNSPISQLLGFGREELERRDHDEMPASFAERRETGGFFRVPPPLKLPEEGPPRITSPLIQPLLLILPNGAQPLSSPPKPIFYSPVGYSPRPDYSFSTKGIGSRSPPVHFFSLEDLHLPVSEPERITVLERELRRAKEILKLRSEESSERINKCQSEFKRALNLLVQEHKKEMQAKFRDIPTGRPTLLELKSLKGKVYTATARSTENFQVGGRSEERKSVIDRHKVQIIQFNDQWNEKLASLKSAYIAEIRPLQEKISVIARELGRLKEQNEEIGMVIPSPESDTGVSDRYSAPFSPPLLSLIQTDD